MPFVPTPLLLPPPPPLVTRTWIFARAEINRANLPVSNADATRAALFRRSEKRDGVRLIDVELEGGRPRVLVFPRGDNPYCRGARSLSYVIGWNGRERFATAKNNRARATGFDEVAVVMTASGSNEPGSRYRRQAIRNNVEDVNRIQNCNSWLALLGNSRELLFFRGVTEFPKIVSSK